MAVRPAAVCGYLDQQIAARHRTFQAQAGSHRGCGVVCQRRRNFKADITVVAGSRLEYRLQQVAGRLDVGDRQRLVALFC